MKPFMDDNFLLTSETAQHLYHEYAAVQPIIDYHCHLDPQEIYEDRKFENITQLWLGADHYKWRLMRSAGVEEKYITGDASDREKFQKWAETLSLAIGNPLYHWSHLELRRYFGYDGILNSDTAEEVWDICNEKLSNNEMSARNLIRQSGVIALCTTDDPADDLVWHKRLTEDKSFEIRVLPSFRPDKALAIERPDYTDYIKRLGEINDYGQLLSCLKERLEYFAALGCRVSDHGIESIPFCQASKDEVNDIFTRRCLQGEIPDPYEQEKFRTALLMDLGKEYANLGIVMQMHFGVIRDNSSRLFSMLGHDAGADSIGNGFSSKKLAAFLDTLDESGQLPRTILYSLDPKDNIAIETVMGSFQSAEAVGKLQHGSAWWFNDNKTGMTDQLTSLANEGFLAGFVGMLTDSRSFLSYARHEYFRRILCDLIGSWVENGEYPNDESALGTIVNNICCENAKRYFRL